jgi:hypothetical protein
MTTDQGKITVFGVVQIKVTVFLGYEGRTRSLGGVEASGFIWDTRRP